jgi:pyridinium-3,5-biscarboxylic acid mononucleotide sulfurtransferase
MSTEKHDPFTLLGRLQSWMRDYSSVLVAYSGGVDSALLMAVAHSQLGPRALACVGASPSYPKRELDAAVALAQRLGAAFRIVNTEEHLDPQYAANPDNRCYFCKTDLYDHLTRIAAAEGLQVIVDGNNASDLGDYRPGRMAAQEHGVRSPFIELGITKEEIRDIARHLGLPVWDKPSMPCLASRVPHGQAIVPTLLHQIERAEDALAALGFSQYRVRHHGEVARIEVPADDLPRALELRQQIVEGVLAAGYRFVAVDLAGFKSGNLSPSPVAKATPHRSPA